MPPKHLLSVLVSFEASICGFFVAFIDTYLEKLTIFRKFHLLIVSADMRA